MSNYTTQMDAARKGIVTPEIEKVAKKEKMDVDKLMELVASGKVAIPANKHHKSLDAEGVGSMLRTKINVNLGVSRDCKDYDVEMQKVMSAVKLGAEAIMDLSSHGNTQPFRQKLTSECPAMIGTVPVYDSVIHYQRDLATLTAQDFVDVVRLHAEDGVDFVTLHCGITRKTIDQIKKHKRKMNIVSRGGSLVFAWMCMTGEENPFYEHYDEILEICEEHDVTISLGDACRPGCLADATDVCQIEELVRLGELTKRAWDHNVQVMVEGPGHVPLDQVAANMKVQQSICMGAPFYVLGPLVTDIAPGYDHITAAIGGAVAAMNGAAIRWTSIRLTACSRAYSATGKRRFTPCIPHRKRRTWAMERLLRFAVEHDRVIRLMFMRDGRLFQVNAHIVSYDDKQVSFVTTRSPRAQVISREELLAVDFRRGDDGQVV